MTDVPGKNECVTNALPLGSTALALRGKDGVVFAVEYIVTSKLHEKAPHHRIFSVDTHIGMVRCMVYSQHSPF
jgi:20S proteasome subunit alpha 7